MLTYAGGDSAGLIADNVDNEALQVILNGRRGVFLSWYMCTLASCIV